MGDYSLVSCGRPISVLNLSAALSDGGHGMDMALRRQSGGSEKSEPDYHVRAWRHVSSPHETTRSETDSLDGSPFHFVAVGHERDGVDVSQRSARHALCADARRHRLCSRCLSVGKVACVAFGSRSLLGPALVFRHSGRSLSLGSLAILLHSGSGAATGVSSSSRLAAVGRLAWGGHGGALHSVFVLAGILRYMQLTLVNQKSGSPTKVLLHDHFIHACIAGWIIAFSIILYA